MSYWITTNDEVFTDGPFDSREEAIAAAPEELELEPGERFWSCVAVTETDTYGPRASRVIEDAAERAYDDAECAEDWLDGVTKEQTAELQTALDAAWGAWIDKHGLRPTWWHADEVEEHTAPAAQEVDKMGEPIKCWVVWFEDSASKGAPDPGACEDEFGNTMTFCDKSKAENKAKAWRINPDDKRYTARPATLTVGGDK